MRAYYESWLDALLYIQLSSLISFNQNIYRDAVLKQNRMEAYI